MTQKERTFIAVKPDGVQRGLVGEIIKRFETRGYKLIAIKLVKPSLEQVHEHYIEHKDKDFYETICAFLSSGPIVAMIWEGLGVIEGGRSLLGATRPEDSLPGTIRGDLCIDVGRNICHGSSSLESSEKEIALWFNKAEIVDWVSQSRPWVYEECDT